MCFLFSLFDLEIHNIFLKNKKEKVDILTLFLTCYHLIDYRSICSDIKFVRKDRCRNFLYLVVLQDNSENKKK